MSLMGSVDIPFTNSGQVAKEAKDTASSAMTSANGKNNVYHQADPPTGDLIIGDVWFDSVAGNLMSIWSGTSWGVAKFDFNALIVNQLSAISADLGNVTAGNITGVTMSLANGKFVVQADGSVVFKGDLTGASGTFSGTISGGTIYADGTNGSQFIFTNAVDVNPNTGGVHVYIRPKSTGEVKATLTGTTDTYVPVRASSFPTGSMADYKQDIEDWNESALDLINSATVYQYRLRSEFAEGVDRVRQGLVIGEGYNIPAGVIDGDGVEQYLMNSWSWKAIQELTKKNTDLEERITALELQINTQTNPEEPLS